MRSNGAVFCLAAGVLTASGWANAPYASAAEEGGACASSLQPIPSPEHVWKAVDLQSLRVGFPTALDFFAGYRMRLTLLHQKTRELVRVTGIAVDHNQNEATLLDEGFRLQRYSRMDYDFRALEVAKLDPLSPFQKGANVNPLATLVSLTLEAKQYPVGEKSFVFTLPLYPTGTRVAVIARSFELVGKLDSDFTPSDMRKTRFRACFAPGRCVEIPWSYLNRYNQENEVKGFWVDTSIFRNVPEFARWLQPQSLEPMIRRLERSIGDYLESETNDTGYPQTLGDFLKILEIERRFHSKFDVFMDAVPADWFDALGDARAKPVGRQVNAGLIAASLIDAAIPKDELSIRASLERVRLEFLKRHLSTYHLRDDKNRRSMQTSFQVPDGGVFYVSFDSPAISATATFRINGYPMDRLWILPGRSEVRVPFSNLYLTVENRIGWEGRIDLYPVRLRVQDESGPSFSEEEDGE